MSLVSALIEHVFERIILEDRGPELAPPREVPFDYDPATEPDSWDELGSPPVDAWVGVEGFFESWEQPEIGDAVWLAQQKPLGPDTIPLLTAVPFAELTSTARSNALKRLTEYSAYLESLKADLTAAIAGPEPDSERARRDDFSPEEIAVATNSSVYAADEQIAFARDLRGRLAATWAALREARISPMQARRLSERTRHLPVDVARELEAKMLRYAHRQSLANFTRSLDRWLAKLDPDWTHRARQARREITVDHRAHDDGTGELFIRGPLEDTMTIHEALLAHAVRTKPVLGGTRAERKFAGLRDWAEAALAEPDLPTKHGRVPTVNVTIDLATLLGLRKGIAEIPGAGAIPSEAAAWLLADGAPLRRLVIDEITGQLLDFGTATYGVPPRLADLLIARHVTSATPHSTVPADGCDMEHNIPHHQGGPTNPINVTPVERRWHRAKTHGDWHYEKDPETGIVTWRSPTGLTCIIEPYDYRTDP